MRLTALVAVLLPHAAALAVRPKPAALRPGPNLQPPARVDPAEPAGPRDVVIKLYDISTPELCKAMSLLASKPAYWFPKLSVGVGRRTWSYDGEPEETYDAIIQNAAGGAAAPHPLACFPATPAYHASLPCLPAMPPCHAANLSDCAPGTTSMRRPCHPSLPCGGPL